MAKRIPNSTLSQPRWTARSPPVVTPSIRRGTLQAANHVFGADMEKADYANLDDVELFSECTHVREKLERLPEHHTERVRLSRVLEDLNAEFDKRARSAWATPNKGCST